ncbi:sigma-70 family RNA polymerase sigma factor [Fulvivirgaceae bacterium BMA12]|uniref:Sigma-70 family RNA polymerase sigma factor n=1 Tax=Agaribacillus aureus TaxID=3051825 RepID=A0ABT8LI84_9BACT|nr:sigma-70 family RNA polymerase sigma factor [Fulvivirgaceae bacterium BMA12]
MDSQKLPKISSDPSFHNKEHITTTIWDTKSDFEIWSAFKEGSDEAFAFIYRRYVKLLFNYGCQISSNRDLVMDAIQDTFEYIRKTRRKLGDTQSIKPYLFKSLRRKILVKLKKNKEKIKIEQQANSGFEISLSHESILIDRQVNEERKEKLEKAFNLLPQSQKEAILMYYYEGFSYEEISNILEIKSIRNTRKLVYRAVDNLKKGMCLLGSLVCLVLRNL